MFIEILSSIGAVTLIVAVFSKKENISKIDKINKITATHIGSHFKESASEINKIFLDLKWIEKNDNWYTATELGLKNGANQRYNAKTKNKYIEWEKEIINNQELIEKIENSKTQNTKILNNEKNVTDLVKNKKMTNEEKKEKGDRYESYVANFFREQGYYVWEHGKEKGVLDSGVDLFIKKNEYIYILFNAKIGKIGK